MLTVFILAGALALDAIAVSAGLGASRVPARTLALAALLFGLFQGGMAGIGALGGAWLAAHAAAWDHWIAFVLLALIGGKMVIAPGDPDQPDDTGPGLVTLLALAVATSIDALASGVTLPLLGPAVLVSVGVIAAVTTAGSLIAAAVGRRAGAHLGPWVERLGGLVLVGIGVRILVEHLTAGT